MLNDRELVEHWHLREVLLWLYALIGACGVMGFAFLLCAIAWDDSRRVFSTLAAADVVMGGILVGKLQRVWKRLDFLQEFMR